MGPSCYPVSLAALDCAASRGSAQIEIVECAALSRGVIFLQEIVGIAH
jgi:hypothetical protein